MAKEPSKTMTEKELQDWDALYMYVRNNVLHYDENQKMPKYMVLRLKGMTEGKFISNRNIKTEANYSYDIVLMTFKYCATKINNIVRTKSFDNERHKFNYIMAIIESNINDVYTKVKNMERSKESAMVHAENAESVSVVEYKPTNDNKKKQKKFNDMW